MVDDKFRSYRNHDTVAREGSEQTSRGGIGDLLAELARLTGQGDPYADGGRDGASSAVDNRNSVAREGSELTSRGRIGDLLAELARLTGQGDPYADGGRDGASSALDWAADDASPGQRQQGEDQYVAFSRPQPSPVFSRIRPAETIGGRFCRAPKHRRCCSLRPMTATMAISRRPRLAKLTAPMIITMISRARAGGMVSSS